MMNDDKLTCCDLNSKFKRNGNYYICEKCGKKYVRKKIIYKNNDISNFKSDNVIIKKKLRGRKVNKISDRYVGLLQANKYAIYEIDNFDDVKKIFSINNQTLTANVYENVLYTLTFNNKTILYDIENNGEVIDKSNRKIYYIHSIKNNMWIGLENNIVNVYDERGNILNSILDFGKNYHTESEIKIINIDYDMMDNEIVIFYRYMKHNEYILCASAIIKCNSSIFDIEIIHWDELYSSMTYSFEKQIFYAIKDDILLEIKKNKSVERIIHTPLIHLILDGGISYPTHFVVKPNKIIKWDDKFIFVYDSDLVVINSYNYNVIFCYNAKNGDLIQTCEVINKNHLAFSSGLSTYVIKTYS